MSFNLGFRWCIVASALVRPSLAVAALPSIPADLVSAIGEHERQLVDVQAKVKVTVPEEQFTFYDVDWGYSGGREYISGKMWMTDREAGRVVSGDYSVAFDGDKMRVYRQDDSSSVRTGRIAAFEPINFRGYPTPNTLMGYDVTVNGRLGVAEALQQAKAVRVRSEQDTIDGHPCYVIEAEEIEKAPDWGGLGYDVRLWVDPERDCRVLRLEKYLCGPTYGHWKALTRRVDDIKLQRVDGVWFPVEGKFSNFRPAPKPAAGISDEAWGKMSTEELLEHTEYDLIPLVPMRFVQVDPKTVVINKGIPDCKFTIVFPVGTSVYDEFIQNGHKVQVGETVAKSSEEAVLSASSRPGGSAMLVPRDSAMSADPSRADRSDKRMNGELPPSQSTLGSGWASRRWVSVWVSAGLVLGILCIWLCRRRRPR